MWLRLPHSLSALSRSLTYFLLRHNHSHQQHSSPTTCSLYARPRAHLAPPTRSTHQVATAADQHYDAPPLPPFPPGYSDPNDNKTAGHDNESVGNGRSGTEWKDAPRRRLEAEAELPPNECRMFWYRRWCKYGKRCRHLHDGRKSRVSDPTEAPRAECRFFRDERWCHRGIECRHLHDGRDPRPGDLLVCTSDPPQPPTAVEEGRVPFIERRFNPTSHHQQQLPYQQQQQQQQHQQQQQQQQRHSPPDEELADAVRLINAGGAVPFGFGQVVSDAIERGQVPVGMTQPEFFSDKLNLQDKCGPQEQVKTPYYSGPRVNFRPSKSELLPPTTLPPTLHSVFEYILYPTPPSHDAVSHMRLVPSAVARSFSGLQLRAENPCLFQGHLVHTSSDWSQHNFRAHSAPSLTLSAPHPSLAPSMLLPPSPRPARYTLPAGPTFFTHPARMPAVCRHWERQGLADGQACKMGNKCTFAHGPSQLGKPLGQNCVRDLRGVPKASSSPESLTRNPQRDTMSALPGDKSDPTADPHDPPSSPLGQHAIIKRGHNFRPARVRRRRNVDEEEDLRALLTLCCLFSVTCVYSSTHLELRAILTRVPQMPYSSTALPSTALPSKMCRHWVRGGLADGQACKMGPTCTFAHGPSQLGKPLGQDRDISELPDYLKLSEGFMVHKEFRPTKLCWHWTRQALADGQACSHPGCSFAHGPSQLRQSLGQAENPIMANARETMALTGGKPGTTTNNYSKCFTAPPLPPSPSLLIDC